LQQHCDIPVVEGVRAAVGLAEQLVRADLTTAKSGLWSTPPRLPADYLSGGPVFQAG